MSLIQLSRFRTTSSVLIQYLNTENDATYFHNSDTDEIFFKIDSDGYLYNNLNVRIGKFRSFGVNNWAYYGEDGVQLFNLGPDLLHAECMVIQILLKDKVPE